MKGGERLSLAAIATQEWKILLKHTPKAKMANGGWDEQSQCGWRTGLRGRKWAGGKKPREHVYFLISFGLEAKKKKSSETCCKSTLKKPGPTVNGK